MTTANNDNFFSLVAQLTQAHINETQEIQRTFSDRLHETTEALRSSQRETETIRSDFNAFRDLTNVQKASLESQLAGCQSKLSKAIKKLRILMMPSNNQNQQNDQLDALDTDLYAIYASENDKLRIKLAEVERLREMETSSYSAVVRDLQRENLAMMEQVAAVEGKWMERLVHLAGSGIQNTRNVVVCKESLSVDLPVVQDIPVEIQPMRQHTAIIQRKLSNDGSIDKEPSFPPVKKRAMTVNQEAETQLPTQQPILKKQKQSPPAPEVTPVLSTSIPHIASEALEPILEERPADVAEVAPDDENLDAEYSDRSQSPPQPITPIFTATRTTPASNQQRRSVGGASGYKALPSRLSKEIKFQEVVREKDERRKLHGATCPCCSGFYEAAGHVPPIVELGQAAPSSEKNSHVQKVSRHRTAHEAPCTPDGFWEVGFPTTQDLDRRKSGGGGGSGTRK
ncbi:UNVERIFIED_CONTAM: hypothetical protein HDU68_007431 [Siphonaria sp. JEL0065]|nr:hypothetical protein HDU68_007431 [Siphonaria sp. JEL0065]